MRNLLVCLLSLIFVYSCTNDKKKDPASALETGREFIRASLDGDFTAAENLLLKDTQNLELFDTYKSYYERLPQDKKKHYKDANYTINKYSNVDDSTTIINYSNDYMNKAMEIKVVKENADWKVDFKYTYSGNSAID